MLLIEGSDNLGKTVLAKKIVRKISDMGLPVIYSWMTRPNEDVFDFFLDYKKLLNPYAVQDRFHLSGLAYHENKISHQNLQIINAWIRSVGGLIIVLYAGDEIAYKKRLEQDKRGNLLPINKLCVGNAFYKKYALNNDIDWRFNIISSITHSFAVPMYVGDYDIDEIINEWLKRRKALGL